MDTNEWTPERVMSELRANATGSGLDDDLITGLATRALFLMGRGHTELEPEIASFYPEFARRVGGDARRQIFERMCDHARSGLLRSDVLVQFLRLESERGIVAEAAFDAARIDVPAPDSETRGADYVLELVVTGSVVNPGAALAGLLALASDNVNAKLRLLRPALALCEADAALAEMSRHAREHVHAATVEFWLEWMESLAGNLPAAQRVFDRAADALVAQRQAIGGQVVFDGSWIAPPPQGTAEDAAGARELPLGRFAASVTPRLAALAAAAPESPSLRRALAAWTLIH
jgi:hypothetical protein